MTKSETELETIGEWINCYVIRTRSARVEKLEAMKAPKIVIERERELIDQVKDGVTFKTLEEFSSFVVLGV